MSVNIELMQAIAKIVDGCETLRPHFGEASDEILNISLSILASMKTDVENKLRPENVGTPFEVKDSYRIKKFVAELKKVIG